MIEDVQVKHVRVKTEKSCGEVAAALEARMGRFDAAVYDQLTRGDAPEAVRARLEGMVGPSGFMLFRTSDHGALLRLVGQKKKAVQYLVGNPLFAIQMTQHDVRAGLYAPLRVLLYEDEDGNVERGPEVSHFRGENRATGAVVPRGGQVALNYRISLFAEAMHLAPLLPRPSLEGSSREQGYSAKGSFVARTNARNRSQRPDTRSSSWTTWLLKTPRSGGVKLGSR